jgi:hypothetical protein
MRRRLFWHACHLRPGPRCEDLPPAEKAQRRFHRIILVVPPILNADGTTSASSKQDAYFIPFLRDLHQYGPEGMWQKVCDPPSSAYLLAKPCPQAQGSLSHQPFATLRQAPQDPEGGSRQLHRRTASQAHPQLNRKGRP